MQKILLDALILVGVGIGMISITAQIAHGLFSEPPFNELSWKTKMVLAGIVGVILSVLEWYTYTLL